MKLKLPGSVVSRRLLTLGLWAIFVFIGLIFGSLALAQSDGAIVVNSAIDDDKKNDGQCTLREAIISVNSGKFGGKPGECSGTADAQGGYTILIDESVIGTNILRLTRTDNGSEDSSNTGDLDIGANITLSISASNPIVIEAGPGFTDRIFHVLPTGKLTVDRVSIRGGNAKEFGGGILVDGGELFLSNSTLTANHAGTSGGALYNSGTAVLDYVTVIDNAVGTSNSPTLGGLVNAGSGASLTLNNSYLANNTCGGPISGEAAHNIAPAGANCQASLTENAGVSLIPLNVGGAPAAFEQPADKSSAAFNAAGAQCPATDQLGLARPQYGACDIGATELENVNDPPVANADTSVTDEDNAVDIDVQLNDSAGADDDDQTLTTTSVFAASNGTATILSSPASKAGWVNFDPDPDFFGTGSFYYEVCDIEGLCDTALVTVTVNSVNDAPTANDDPGIVTAEDTPVDIDVQANDNAGPANEDQSLTTTLVASQQPSLGSATVLASGQIRYTPNDNKSGADTFGYQVCDTDDACDTATVSVTIDPVNDAPNANDDLNNETQEDLPIIIDVAANDTDPEGNLDPASVTVAATPAHGTLDVIGDGSIEYTPGAHYDGADTFDYQICDTDGDCSTASVGVSVIADAYLEVTNVCDSGAGSLRAAMNAANSSSGPDSIVFDIIDLTCGSDTILLQTALPALTGPVVIDGLAVDADPVYKPAGSFSPPSSTPYIVINGGDNGFGGITIGAGADGSTVRNITLTQFSGDGLIIEGSGLPALGNTIENNTISNNGGSGVVIGNTANPGDNNTLQGNSIANNCGSGVVIFGFEADESLSLDDFEGNLIQGNTITNNGNCGSLVEVEGTPANDGVTIPAGQKNEIVDNDFSNNNGLPIDLDQDGVTDNDEDDGDEGPNYTQNFPYLWTATPGGQISGMLNSTPGGAFTLHFYRSDSCAPQNLQLLDVSTSAFADTEPAPIGNDGTIIFYTEVQSPSAISEGQFVLSTATDSYGNTSEFGPCILVEDDNTVFTRSRLMGNGQSAVQSLNLPGQARWYMVQAGAQSKIEVTLNLLDTNTDLDLDLVAYSDLAKAYAELVGQKDLNRLDIEFATDAFGTAEFNPAYVNPAYVNQAEYNPAYVNPAYVNPAYVNAALYSADVYSPAYVNPAYVNPAYVNQADYNPAYVNPAYVNPAYVNPAYVNPAYVNPAYVNANAYSAAQMSTIVAASGNDGQESEEMGLFTYNNPGTYFVRVRARQGGFDPNIDYEISFAVEGGICDSVQEDFGTPAGSRLAGVADNYEAIVLIDYGRMGLDAAGQTLLADSLADLIDPANPHSIHAAVVDVGLDPEVTLRNAQADSLYQCAYAKNVVADGIKDIVDSYRQLNPDTLQYVVIVGNDDHIPFYRHADQAGLGPEEQYVVPVDGNTASFAALQANTFYSQDSYGSTVGLAMKNVAVPLPGIPVGRLVETPQQIKNVIDAYLAEPVMVPDAAFVSSYDFLIDGGDAVSAVLAASVPVTELSNNEWMASDLKDAVDNPGGTGRLFDIGYWAGHFSATAALAADYETYYWSSDFLNSPQDYTGAIIYSAGCHSGYNIVNSHAIPNYTPDNVTDPDWPAAMAARGATLIAGTGYQYGDTDFVEYSERLYLEFTRALRSGNPGEAISIGNAMVEAKKKYLQETPSLSGIHQKALLEATIYGLPMNSVNFPGARLDPPPPPPQLGEADLMPVTEDPQAPFSDNGIVDTPGEVLGLLFYDLDRQDTGVNYNLTEQTKTFTDIASGGTVDVTYLENGPGGVLVDAGAPVLPLDTFDASVGNASTGAIADIVLRGVGFLGGDYRDFAGKFPLVSAATTESSAIHANFLSFVFYPQQPWTINRFDALEGGAGRTLLNITPAQYRTEQFSAEQAATRRQFDNLQLRLFYLPENFLDGIDTGFNRPDLSAAPHIVRVEGQPGAPGQVEFEVEAVIDPSAGMQQVWISYTTLSTPTTNGTSGTWQPFFLAQDPLESTIWRGTLDLPAGVDPQNVRFIASAVSGVGLVTMSNNVGLFYTVGEPSKPTQLAVDPYPASGQIGTTVPFAATLSLQNPADSGDLTGLPIIFNIGQDYRLGWTDSAGIATVDMPLVSTAPGFHEVTVSFPGNNEFGPSTADTPNLFEVLAGQTELTLDKATISVGSLMPDVDLNATLTEAVGEQRPLAELTVTFSIFSSVADPLVDDPLFQKAVITNQQGVARLGLISLLGPDSYKVTARFDGTSTYEPVTAPGFSTLLFNKAPDCSGVYLLTENHQDEIWPVNGRYRGLQLFGATDADGDPLTYQFLDIFQDEPLSTSADGQIVNSCSEAQVYADRDGGGDGRVYQVTYRVEDGRGGSCGGIAKIAVAHDQADIDAIDQGPLFHSLNAPAPVCASVNP